MGGLLTAWPSVQFCTPARHHEVGGRWRDTWQKCAWGRSLCRVTPPDRCKDQLEETETPGSVWAESTSAHLLHKHRFERSELGVCSHLIGRWPCVWDYFPAGWCLILLLKHRLVWTVWLSWYHSDGNAQRRLEQHQRTSWNMTRERLARANDHRFWKNCISGDNKLTSFLPFLLFIWKDPNQKNNF